MFLPPAADRSEKRNFLTIKSFELFCLILLCCSIYSLGCFYAFLLSSAAAMAVNSTFELSEIPAKARDAENGQDMYSTRDEAEMAHLGRYPVLKVRGMIRIGVG